MYLFIYLFVLFIIKPSPPPRGRHATCHEISYSIKETKVEKQKKNRKFSPLCPLSCRHGYKRSSTLQDLHIAVATHNCGISPRRGVHPPGYAPCIPSHKPPPFTPILDHSPCLSDIQNSSFP